MHGVITYRSIDQDEIKPLLAKIPLFLAASGGFECISSATIIEAPEGKTVIEQDRVEPSLHIVLAGQLRVTKTESDGGRSLIFHVEAGEICGEAALMFDLPVEPVNVEAAQTSTLLRVQAEVFWRLLTDCPAVRREVGAIMTRRYEMYQRLVVQRQSLLSVGTLSAGLMHELNNPGAAALRAVGHIRENLIRMQTSCLRLTQARLTNDQVNCCCYLQEQAHAAALRQFASDIDQADAEEKLAAWIEEIGVEDAWRLASTFTRIGWGERELACVRDAFPSGALSDTLHLVEAISSSVQVLDTMEESLRRVTSLVAAVKKYAHDDGDDEQVVDIHESLRSAITLAGHKFDLKQLVVAESLSPDVAKIKIRGRGLIQAWTNLLENAGEASPDHGRITIRTWVEGRFVCVGIADRGPGILPEKRAQIFQPFFTTKPFGAGPGLGLHMVHRIVVGQCGGQVTFQSEPGATEFVVRLPVPSG